MIWQTLTYNGINSSDYGIRISGEAVYNAPDRIYEMIDVPGRNGQLARDQGRFSNIEVTYPAFIVENDRAGFADRLAQIRSAFLSQKGYQRLTDTYHPDEFRLAVYKTGLDVSPIQVNTAGDFDLVFDCKPQRFLTSGETAQTFNSDGTITNPEAFASTPLLEVTGIGTLGIGSYSMTITGESSQVLFIDCDVMEAWEVVGGAKQSRNDYIQYAGNKFPVLEPGSNGIDLGTGITKVKITPRWWRI